MKFLCKPRRRGGQIMDTFTFLVLLTTLGDKFVLSTMNSMVDLDECTLPLGMESGDIPDEAITASSTYDEASVGAKYGRVRRDDGGGAWCPKHVIGRDVYEYLQIEFPQLVVIKKVETQGRYGQGHGKEYTEQYLIEYQRENVTSWTRYRKRTGREMFNGNWDTNTAVRRELDPVIIAKRVRVVPYSSEERMACLRVEFHGCNWTEGIVSYEMQQGDRYSDDVEFIDYIYDGQSEFRRLSHGLGQLTDFLIGSNRVTSYHGYDKKGYPWVGWKRVNANENRPKEILFTFDANRQFYNMSIHCINRVNRRIKIFRKAIIYFSLDGSKWLGKSVEFRPLPLNKNYATWIGIPLHGRAAKYLRVKLYFHKDSTWMLISEVSFWSELLDDNSSVILSDVDPSVVEEYTEPPRFNTDKFGSEIKMFPTKDPKSLNSDELSAEKDSVKTSPTLQTSNVTQTTTRRKVVVQHVPRTKAPVYRRPRPTRESVAYESRDSGNAATSIGRDQNSIQLFFIVICVGLFHRIIFSH